MAPAKLRPASGERQSSAIAILLIASRLFLVGEEYLPARFKRTFKQAVRRFLGCVRGQVHIHAVGTVNMDDAILSRHVTCLIICLVIAHAVNYARIAARFL